MIDNNYKRTLGAGVHQLYVTDLFININTNDGGSVSLILPKISDMFDFILRTGNNYNFSGIRFFDIGNNASVNNIIFQANPDDKINTSTSIILNTNGVGGLINFISDNDWCLNNNNVSLNADSIGIAEVPVTFVNTGGNYYARYGTVNVIIGNTSDFTKVNAPSSTSSDLLYCSKEIIQCYASYYFQLITQTGGQRIFASLFGGSRSAGGAISAPLSINNARISHQINLGYVQANQPITSTLNWNGLGTLTNNSSKLIINYKK